MARPFWRRTSLAFSRSPLASSRACLQSRMPAPVSSRSSLTASGEIGTGKPPGLARLGSLDFGGWLFLADRLGFIRGGYIARLLVRADFDAFSLQFGLLGVFTGGEAIQDGVGDPARDELDGTDGVIVGGDGVIDK